MDETFTKRDLCLRLTDACEEQGGQAAWAELHGVSPQLVNAIVLGRRGDSKQIADASGFEKVVRHIAKEDADVA
jgi:DNA-binding transcriptional regulator YdaS (Cro superfamily)